MNEKIEFDHQEAVDLLRAVEGHLGRMGFASRARDLQVRLRGIKERLEKHLDCGLGIADGGMKKGRGEECTTPLRQPTPNTTPGGKMKKRRAWSYGDSAPSAAKI